MSIRRLELLQWTGFLAGGITWFAVFVAGAGVSVAACNPASRRFGIPYDPLETGLTVFAAVCILGAEVAAIAVYRAVRRAADQDPPPEARLRFFAIAAMAGNVLFLVVILLSGIATIVLPECHQA